MLTCPNCNKDMHPVCGREDCVCRKRIPEEELPMKNIDLFLGKFYISAEIGSAIWHWMLWLNIGYWIDKLNYQVLVFYNNIKRKMHIYNHYTSTITNVSKYLGILPHKFIFELQECPYCGYKNSYDYWEDRNITQTFPDGNWDNPINYY